VNDSRHLLLKILGKLLFKKGDTKVKKNIIENKTVQRKRIPSVIALILLMTSATMMGSIMTTSAHSPPWAISTYAYLTITPNPVGVGQTATVNFWIDKQPPTASGPPYGSFWTNLTVTVTKPDGSIEQLGPFTSDGIGGSWTTYMPNSLGNYTFVFNFPGQTIEMPPPGPGVDTSYVGDIYLPSTSEPCTLVVQEQKVEPIPGAQLPTDYWQRPIYGTNREWYALGGNWLGLGQQAFANTGKYNASGNFNPYTTAPNTAHIVWTKSVAFGGIIGGEFGGTGISNYYSTSQYESKFEPIIMNGILYYTEFPGSATGPAGWVAVDLRTGQTLWTKNTTDWLRCGQILNFVSPDEYGGRAYLWSTSEGILTAGGAPIPTKYSMYDAMTGNWILNVTDAVTLKIAEDEHGSLVGYYVNSTSKTLNLWNSTLCLLQAQKVAGPGDSAYPNMWRPAQGANVPFSLGIQWSKPLETSMSSIPIIMIESLESNVVLLEGEPTRYTNWYVEAGYDADTGALLWGPINRTTEAPWTYRTYFNAASAGVYAVYTSQTMTWTGYSLFTGDKLWSVNAPTNAWGYYGCGFNYFAANGKIYSWDLGGVVYCIDIKTGEINWTWHTESSGLETLMGQWPLWIYDVASVADGKLYVPGGREYGPPLFRGARLYSLNTTTGDEVWSILGFFTNCAPAIADGYMVTNNAYDNQIYCFGKGRTATTVSTQTTPAQLGAPVLNQGTITDQSPGQT
jgi:hypothetical protein